ncbi:hypothetical protein Tco_1244298 [Tanacetum coccineum]
MAWLSMCGELRPSSDFVHWEPMFILYCHRSVGEDYRIMGEINRMAREVNGVAIVRDPFLEELDRLDKRKTMERPSKCEELERAVGESNWLNGDMIVACEDSVAFVGELQSVVGETVSAKTAVFLEEMMNKEGSMEWQLRGLEKEVREMVFEIDSFLLKLMDEEPSHKRVFRGDDGQRDAVSCLDRTTQSMAALPICDELRRAINSPDWEARFILYCRRAISEDQSLAWQINALCDTLTSIIDEKENFVQELDVLANMFIPKKMGEFMKESLGKDIPNLMKLQILGREFKLRAREKEVFIEKLKGNMEF